MLKTENCRSLILEVIVCSVTDALEAERGGADRTEVVRDLDRGGLTPYLDLVRQNQYGQFLCAPRDSFRVVEWQAGARSSVSARSHFSREIQSGVIQ